MVKHKLLIESPETELQLEWEIKIKNGDVCVLCYTNLYPLQKLNVVQITKSDGMLHISSGLPDNIGLQVTKMGRIKVTD